MSPLRVGALHLGREEGGLRRYGRILAEALANAPGVEVVDVDAGSVEDGADLAAAGRSLRGVDVVQIQVNLRVWGSGPRSVLRLRSFVRVVGAPVVATLHDVLDYGRPRRRYLSSHAWMLRLLARAGVALVVHSQQDERRVKRLVPGARIARIPHFVEERTLPDAQRARAELGVTDQRLVTVLGFVFPRKGHDLLVSAIPHLPSDVLVVFAGGAVRGLQHMVDGLRAQADAQGTSDRLLITGYLEESALGRWMAATHLAVCPFRNLSASGSLSTWIAAGKPILASDLPAVRDYDELEPGAIRRFAPITAEALADSVGDLLRSELPDPDPAVGRLARRLALPAIAGRYADLYRSMAGRSADR